MLPKKEQKGRRRKRWSWNKRKKSDREGLTRVSTRLSNLSSFFQGLHHNIFMVRSSTSCTYQASTRGVRRARPGSVGKLCVHSRVSTCQIDVTPFLNGNVRKTCCALCLCSLHVFTARLMYRLSSIYVCSDCHALTCLCPCDRRLAKR